MKKLILLGAVLLLSACGAETENMGVDVSESPAADRPLDFAPLGPNGFDVNFDGTQVEYTGTLQEDVMKEEWIDVPYQDTCSRQVPDGTETKCETRYKTEQKCDYEQVCRNERECRVVPKCNQEQVCHTETECNQERICRPEQVCHNERECHVEQQCSTRNECHDERQCRDERQCTTRNECHDEQVCRDERKCEIINDKRECRVERVCDSRPVCKPVQDCRTEQVCTNRPVCRPVQDCRDQRVCQDVPRCTTVDRCNYEQVCHQVPRCRWENVCRDERECFDVPRCNNEYICRPYEVPYNHCYDVPKYRTEYYTCTKTRRELKVSLDYKHKVNLRVDFEVQPAQLAAVDLIRVTTVKGELGVQILRHSTDLFYTYKVEVDTREIAPQEKETEAVVTIRAIPRPVLQSLIQPTGLRADTKQFAFERPTLVAIEGMDVAIGAKVARAPNSVVLDRALLAMDMSIKQKSPGVETVIVTSKALGIEKEMKKKGTYSIEVKVVLLPVGDFKPLDLQQQVIETQAAASFKN